MDEHIQRFLNREKDLNSKSAYIQRKGDLTQFYEWADERGFAVKEIGAMELDRYLRYLKMQDYAPATVSSKYYSLSSFYSTLSGLFDVIDENPMEDVTRSDYIDRNTKDNDDEKIRFVTQEEKETLAEQVPGPKLRNELIIRLLWQTGIRQCELVIIELDDIDRDERSIDIWSPKTKSSRTVFYQPSLDFLLQQWLDGGHRASCPPAADSEYLLVTPKSAQFRTDRVNKIVKQAAENAGIQDTIGTDQGGQVHRRITGHALRHGHARHALQSGIDLRTVQEHLGHNSIDITERYLQLLDEDVKDGYQRFAAEA